MMFGRCRSKDKQASLASLSEADDDNEDLSCCVHCSLRFATEQERTDHEVICTQRVASKSHSAEIHRADRANNNSANRRRKRDNDFSEEEEEETMQATNDLSADEMEPKSGSLPKKQARDEDILGSDRIPEGSNLSSVLNPLIPNGLFPYAATIANANVTLDALQNTKMALAQYAATALAKNGQDNPAALQELAVVQSTLYALQQQQLIQLQLLQQLQQQLHISQTEGHQPVPENLLNMFGYVPNLANEPANSSNGSRTPTPGLESYPADKETPQCGSAHDEQLPSYNSHISNVEQTTNEQSSNESNEESKQSPSKPSFSTTFAQSTCSVPYGSALSQLPGGSLADMILQTSEPPPNPDGPSTLEMLQRTAQQVLNNASQGLLATNLADELGLRSNGGSSGDGKKDQMFKHRCRYCGKVFSSDSALQIHIRSHTGERPFKCNICGNRFTTKGNLKVHFQRHAARFPHVKMNPHPVPEHLDKFYPPLLAQMDIEESKLSPSNPGVPFSHPATSPGSQTHRPTPTGLSASLSSPFSRPVANTSDHPPPTRVNAKHLSLHSLMREGSLITVSQESPENLTKAPQSEPAPVEKDEQEPGNLEVSVKTEKCDVDDEELQPSQATLPNADVSVSEKSENFGDARNFSHDELSQESHYDSQDYNVSNNTQLDNEINKDCSNMEAPEDLSGRRSSASVSSSPSSTANPVAMGSGLPFNPVNLAPLAGPQLRFSLPFPLPGPLGNFPSGVVMREPSPTAPGITLQTPAGPIMLPPDIDPAKDPAIYTNLLPRPGSNDNSWESLIEITKTSETSKLQQLVDNIENKLVDPNQCVVCHRVLSCKSALQMHYRTHTGERPFKCKICSRAFTTKGNLKTHMGVHRAKPPARMLHMCPVCHKKFTNGFVLQQHIRLHTGEPTDLTPDQIQAAEVRDFPAPFPFIGGFHPFLPHAPFAPMAMPHPFGPNPGGRPFAFHFRQDAAAKEGAEGQEGQEGDINTEGSSSGALSPASSSTSSHFVTTTPAKNDGVNEVGQSVLRCPTEEDWRKYKEFSQNEESQGRKSPANSEAGEFHFAVKKAMSEDGHPETQGSRSPSPAPNATKTSDFVESHSAKELSDIHKSSNETAEPHSERFYNWLTAQSNFLDRSLTVQKSEPDTVKPGVPLPNLSSRHPPAFFPGFNILPPSSVSPSAAANSALSSLTSAVMTQPSFNPLNLPISAPGRGNTTCNICFKTFACHSALEIHYRSHTKERPFKCTICDRGFSTKGNMKQHMMTHKNRDGTPLLLCDKSNERSPRSRDSSASEREQPLETLNKRETNLKSTTNKEMESIELSSINSAAPKEHCLSLTIQRSGDAPNGLPKITDHKEPTIAHQNKTQSSQGIRNESYGEDRPSFISGYEARLAGIVRPNMATETQFHVHGASTSHTILPIAPTAMP